MIDRQSFADQPIIDCLNTHYGIQVAALIFIPLGADIDAAVYKAQTYGHTSYFVKLRRGAHNDIGTIIQRLLYEAGVAHIIGPVTTRDNNLTQDIDDFTLIVYPFIQGQDGFTQDLNNNQWVNLGQALKQIHTFQLPSSLKNQIKKESYSSKWRQTVRAMYTHIDSELKMADDIALKLLMFMQEHREVIQHVVDRAEQLAQKIEQQSPELVLCHADLHGGNVLISHDGSFYIVDWDQPIMAPKERDLMFIGGGVANVWNNPHEQNLFYQGYGKTEINRDILTYYRHERIVEDIAIYSQQLLLTSDGGKDRLEMYQQFIGMFEPNGVVDIALKTDK